MDDVIQRVVVAIGLGAAVVAFGQSESQTASHVPIAICGRWTVKRVLPTAGLSAGPEAVEQFIGKEALYTSAEARFADQVMRQPAYRVELLAYEEFVGSFSVFPDRELGINGTLIARIGAADSAPNPSPWPGDTLLVRGNDELIVRWFGEFMLLVRTGDRCPETDPPVSVGTPERNGTWWLALSGAHRRTVVDGYDQYYRTEGVTPPLDLLDVDRHALLLFAQLGPRRDEWTRRLGEVIEAAARTLPPNPPLGRAPFSLDDRMLSSGDDWRQLEPALRLKFIQGALECARRHPRLGFRYSKDAPWYVAALARWYGLSDSDPAAIQRDRASFRVVDALRLLMDW